MKGARAIRFAAWAVALCGGLLAAAAESGAPVFQKTFQVIHLKFSGIHFECNLSNGLRATSTTKKTLAHWIL